MTQKDYYKVLGVERTADSRQIKEEYRRLAFEFHPDRNKGDIGSVEKMKELNEAYAVLSDPEKRKQYDSLTQQYGFDGHDRFRQGYSEQDIFRNSDINQILEEMTRRFGFRSSNDFFREFYGPGYQTFEFRRPGVFGRGFIFAGFPLGKEVGHNLPPQGGLFPSLLGKLAGYLVRKVFKGWETGQAEDRYDVITLSQQDALRGAKVSYIDRDTSRQLIVAVPAGLREGQTIRLRGGVKNNTHDIVTGDLYLKVHIRKGLLEKARVLYGKLTG